jgi:hypothetical protein
VGLPQFEIEYVVMRCTQTMNTRFNYSITRKAASPSFTIALGSASERCGPKKLIAGTPLPDFIFTLRQEMNEIYICLK